MMRFQSRSAFSLVELLVVVGIIAVLVGMLLPAVQQATAMVQRAECANNMKQIGLALHGYLDTYDVFPPAVINPGHAAMGLSTPSFYPGEPYKIYNHMGFTLLLPYLEQRTTGHTNPTMNFRPDFQSGNFFVAPFVATDLAKGPSTSVNSNLVSRTIKTYLCPSDHVNSDGTAVYDRTNSSNSGSLTWAARSNYMFSTYDGTEIHYRDTPIKGLFGMNSNSNALIPDGLSNTLAVGETKQVFSVPSLPATVFQTYANHWGSIWYGGEFGRFTPWPINYRYGELVLGRDARDQLAGHQAPGAYGSFHHGGANFLFGDGSVHFLNNTTPVPLIESLIRIDDGLVIN